MNKSVLRLEDVTMQFGGVVAVNNLSLNVNENEIVALIGPNGAGKTTAFNCITGVYQPTNGRIKYCNELIVANHPTKNSKKTYLGVNGDKFCSDRIIDPTPDEITHLGIARTFQNIRLWNSMSVFDNVLTAKHMSCNQNVLSATFRLSKDENNRIKDETIALLEEQNLIQYKDDLACSLPYGLQRRLEIARALATNPKLLLLDEPAAGMNPQETDDLGKFIVEIKNKYKLTIFMIEHHMDLVMKFSNRIYVLEFGKLIAEGEPTEIQNNSKVIEAYLGATDNE